jgi:hypothetical protein
MRIRAACVAVICISTVHAENYFVSNSGRDTNSGLCETHAWRSIARVNRQKLAPGDRVLFRRGDLWRETLRPSSSGTKGKKIIFGAYGRGDRPILTGLDAVQSAGSLQRQVRLRETCAREFDIDNNEQSYITYEKLTLRGAQQGLRLYAHRATVRAITLRASRIEVEPARDGHPVSAGVYANVGASGSFSEVVIRDNEIIPYAHGLNNWGIYFVRGVEGFEIERNRLGPAGEDAITVWHCKHGLIRGNTGGHNGENTIDVKDSSDVAIVENQASDDAEYNIVIHSVDNLREDRTSGVVVERNRCRRGGLGGHLTAGIAMLFVRGSLVANNVIEDPRGEAVLVRDADPNSSNEVSENVMIQRTRDRRAGLVILQESPGTLVRNNHVQRSSGPKPQVASSAH